MIHLQRWGTGLFFSSRSLLYSLSSFSNSVSTSDSEVLVQVSQEPLRKLNLKCTLYKTNTQQKTLYGAFRKRPGWKTGVN